MLALPLLLGALWSPHFPLHAPALMLLSRQGEVLAHLDSLSPLTNCFRQTALFLFLLTKAALGYLPTALSVALRPLFPFRQAQYVHIFSLKPVPFCKLFGGLGNINKSATSLLLLSDSRSVLTTLPSPPSFLLPQTLWQELSSLYPVLSGYNGSSYLSYPFFSFLGLEAYCLIEILRHTCSLDFH